MYILTDGMREEVRRPFGKIFTGDKLTAEYEKAEHPLITVGDQCALDAMAAGYPPDIMIFDFKIKRVEINKDMKETFAAIGAAKSPYVVLSGAGFITDELEEAVRKVLSEGRGSVFVAGEDDLSSLLVMAFAKQGTLIYGQPNEGAVVVELGGAIAGKALGILGKMKQAHD
jgi:uncharacterized protein (UPF0218 family)